MAGRHTYRSRGAHRRSAWAGCVTDRAGQRGDDCAVRFCDHSLGKLEGRIRGRGGTICAGESLFQHALADAWLLVFGAYAYRAGAFPPRKAVAVLVSAAAASDVGEHARLVHHRTGSDLCLSGMRIKGISAGRDRRQKMDSDGAHPAGTRVSSEPSGASDYAIRNEARVFSL